jgi:signal transduction histidine kinase
VLADGSQIDHVITNLLVNAIKFSPPDSAISITLHPEDTVMRACVEDEGPGIPKDERERIFDKFYSVAAGKTSGGAGLGLYICRELVHKHGGRIWVEERPGSGSRFCFTLPLVGDENTQEEGPEWGKPVPKSS